MRLSESKSKLVCILPSMSIFAVFDGKGNGILLRSRYTDVTMLLQEAA